MNRTFLINIVIILFFYVGTAQNKQDSLRINVDFMFNSTPLILGENYISKQQDTLSFKTIKMYLTDFQLNYKKNTSTKEEGSFHLIDFESPESLSFYIPIKKNNEITSIHFNIGVDSTASVSGAMKGDLDATKGMYWAWQSGFINFKIEGKSTSCNTRKNKFQFHVGGYLNPYYAMRKINFNGNFNSNNNDKNEITIQIDLAKLFDEINLKETNEIMIPGKEAMRIADLSTKMFKVE